MTTAKEKRPRIVLRGPDEHQIQAALFDWAKIACRHYPEVRLLYAVPNAGKRSYRAAAYYKAEGLRSGVPDVVLPVPCGGYGALYIEHKAEKGRVSDDQRWWLRELAEAGNLVVVSRSFEESRRAIVGYLEQRK